MPSHVLSKVATIIGILCVVVGVAWGFLDETTHFRFLSDYAGLFLITLAIGICSSAGGIVTWSRHLDRGNRLRVAGFIFALGLLAFLVTPINVHGPTMLLGITAACAAILSLVLMLMAVVGKETVQR